MLSRGVMAGGIVEHLRARCAHRPEGTATVGNQACRFPRMTYAQVFEAADDLAAGFVDFGIRHGDHVGVISENLDLWLLTDLALLSIGAATVPRGGEASPAEVGFCLTHAECRAAVFETAELVERASADLPHLAGTVAMRGPAPRGGTTLDELIERGRKLRRERPGELRKRQEAVKDEDLATIVYTSGTTGNPKGVMLTHRSILHNVKAVPAILHFEEGMRFVSFLPTWHTFERTIEYIVLDSGIELHYSSKRTLKADVARVRPSFLVGVPRVWETFYQGVMSAIEKLPPKKKELVEGALRGSRTFHTFGRRARGLVLDPPAKLERPGTFSRLLLRLRQAPHVVSELLARKFVYSKLKAALGGELKITISGGGPLPPDVDEFFVRAGIPFLNGYGLTETAPVVCVRLPERNVLGTIGPPLPHTEVRIVDESGRDVGREARGNIQIRGPQVMLGYYRNETASNACLTMDGWFDSGDLGMLSSAGDVIITGRAKDTIVLRGGENVEPENIETALLASPLILDVVVVGHAQKALGALIVPDFEVVRIRLPQVSGDPPEALVEHPSVDDLIRTEVSKIVCNSRGFRTFELVTRVAYLARPFSTEEGTLTATLKKRRRVIEELHRELIAGLFD
jgi:long-chain acyl-CoA synthetase